MLKKVENAENLYLRGIRDGEVQEVLDNYMGDSGHSLKTFSRETQSVISGSCAAFQMVPMYSCTCIRT